MKFAYIALLGLAAAKELDPVPAYFTPFDHEATYYERVTTPRFAEDTDDIFMRSMIEQYALEERNKITEHDNGLKTGGEPNGKFWMNQAATLAAAKEVLEPTRDSLASFSMTTSTPTSLRPGDISMLTRLD